MWQIQFMGRWAAGTVVEYVEEAMAELTASWTRAAPAAGEPSGSRSSSSAAPPEPAPATPGTSGGAPSLSVRIDRLETLLQEMREKGAGEEPRVLPHIERAPEAELSSWQAQLLTGCRRGSRSGRSRYG
jgi:hypothetical protein